LAGFALCSTYLLRLKVSNFFYLDDCRSKAFQAVPEA